MLEVEKWKAVLTDWLEVMVDRRIPNSRPQAAPMSRDGMNTPADTVRP